MYRRANNDDEFRVGLYINTKRKAEITEIEALKAENRRLRSQNAQLRVDLEDERLKAHASA